MEFGQPIVLLNGFEYEYEFPCKRMYGEHTPTPR
jgi:hypothetical protein